MHAMAFVGDDGFIGWVAAAVAVVALAAVVEFCGEIISRHLLELVGIHHASIQRSVRYERKEMRGTQTASPRVSFVDPFHSIRHIFRRPWSAHR